MILRRADGRSLPRSAIAGIAAVVAIYVGVPLGLLSASGTARGGDPGGAIEAELLATRSAIPPGSRPSTYIAAEPKWIGACSDATLRKGWGVVQGVTAFESTLSVARVQSFVAEHLARAGWRMAPGVPRGEWYVDGAEAFTYLMRWTKVLPQKTVATISLQTSIPVRRQNESGSSANWFIGGTADPEPPVGFCGGG